jgi:hypothetical protein
MSKDALPPKIEGWIQDGFFALASLILMYCASQIRELNLSVGELNNKLSVYITRLDSQTLEVKDHEARIRELEKRR